jgi:hypothetical protein
MPGLRARVAKKANRFVKKAQMMPPGAPPAPGAPPGAPPPGDAPMAGPRPPGRPPAGGPPGAPPPGGPPGAPRPKEEIEQNVESDIRKRKETENKINELDEKVTAISDQMEGLTKSINKLVNTIQKDKGGPTDFEKKFEEVKEEEDDELSSSEFGLGNDDESLIVSKEGHKMSDKEKLRKARKERLEAKELTFELKDMPNKKYKQQVPAPTITKLKDEPEDWGQYRLKASDMAMDLNAAGDEWAIVNKHTDQTFYKIKPTAETEEIFSTREFAEAVINDVREMGLEAAMDKYAALPMEFLKKKKEEEGDEDGKPKMPIKMKPKMKDEKKMPPFMKKKEGPALGDEEDVEAKPKFAQTEEDTPAEEVAEEPAEEVVAEEAAAEEPAEEAAAEESAEEAVAEEAAAEEPAEAGAEEAPAEEEAAADEPTETTASLADVQRRFIRAFRLALSAQQKNLTDNPLKAVWYETLKGLDIPNPEKIIEATFARAAAEHFEVALAKTAEFLDMSDEAFVEMESQIGELHTQPPKTASEIEEDEQHKRATELRVRAHNASLPLSTASESDPADFSSRIENALPKPKLHGVSRFADK